jgi:hypothetical protein
MATDISIIASSPIQFAPVSGNLYTVRVNKEIPDNPDQELIINKLASCMEKQDVFSKKSSAYNEGIHGPLYLMIFYGHIYFLEQKPFPQKLGELQKAITEKSNQIIRFNHADINYLNIREVSSN